MLYCCKVEGVNIQSSDKTKNQLKLDHLRTFFLQLVQGVQDWVVDDPPGVDGDQEVEMVATWN